MLIILVEFEKEDVDRFQVLILSEISKSGKWKKFARHIRASDAHAVLDRLEG
jgi:hypothetical protein